MRLPAVLAVAAALTVPTAAVAKEVSALKLCGTDGCTAIVDRAALRAFERGSEMAATAPSGPQRSYLLRISVRDDVGEQHAWTTRWLPAAGVLVHEEDAGRFTFTDVDPVLERALRTAARGRTARAPRVYADDHEPQTQAAEVFSPASQAAGKDDDGGGMPQLAWIGIALGLIAAGGAAARLRRSS